VPAGQLSHEIGRSRSNLSSETRSATGSVSPERRMAPRMWRGGTAKEVARRHATLGKERPTAKDLDLGQADARALPLASPSISQSRSSRRALRSASRVSHPLTVICWCEDAYAETEDTGRPNLAR
jgi:hypothetical protein